MKGSETRLLWMAFTHHTFQSVEDNLKTSYDHFTTVNIDQSEATINFQVTFAQAIKLNL